MYILFVFCCLNILTHPLSPLYSRACLDQSRKYFIIFFINCYRPKVGTLGTLGIHIKIFYFCSINSKILFWIFINKY